MTLTEKDKQLVSQLNDILKKHFENGCIIQEDVLIDMIEEQVTLMIDEIKFNIRTEEKAIEEAEEEVEDEDECAEKE